MIINFFKIAFRNLLRRKGFSLINITGLAIGMASAILILLWIQNEVSHDRFHAKADRIYRVNNRDKVNGEIWAWSNTPKVLGPTAKKDYPEVESAVRVSSNEHFLFNVGDKHLNVTGSMVDSGFLDMFSFPLLQGNSAKALAGNYQIVITEKLAIRLFGKQNALGAVIRLDSTDNFTVTGVLKDLPNNTAFNFEYLLPWSYLTKLGWDDQYWGNNSVNTFLLLRKGVRQADFDRKIKNITINHSEGPDHSTTTVFTQLYRDAWLYSAPVNGQYVGGRIEKVKLFAIIAGFILLIACINFMNLSTARSERRAKEVGIRKVVGGSKNSLVIQFLGESILISLLSGILAIMIVEFSLPAFNLLVDRQLFVNFRDGQSWALLVGFILITGLIAGSYPAFYLSAFQPARVLKGPFKAGNGSVSPRKILVVLQFSFAIALIISTIIVEHQIRFAQNRDAGYTKDQLVFTPLSGDIRKNYDLIKQDLLSGGAAIAVTKSMSPITQHYSDGWGVEWPGSTVQDQKTDFIRMSSDADFVKTIGVQLIEGRDIDIKNYVSDSTAILLNETAVKIMRLKNPLGQIVKSDDKQWHIVGVLKDFVYASPYQKIQQLIVFGPASWFNVVHYKLNPARPVAANLASAEQIFKRYNPQYPFDYQFVDEAYGKKFEDEQRTGNLAALFAGLTIFISCLGLFGLATYMAENRVKEIGIRKVLGASVAGITALLSRDFLKLVLIAFAIASPVAWFAMHSWLSDYAYRISIPWWVFAVAGMMSVLVAILTVSYQAIRAALANPVKSLRSE